MCSVLFKTLLSWQLLEHLYSCFIWEHHVFCCVYCACLLQRFQGVCYARESWTLTTLKRFEVSSEIMVIMSTHFPVWKWNNTQCSFLYFRYYCLHQISESENQKVDYKLIEWLSNGLSYWLLTCSLTASWCRYHSFWTSWGHFQATSGLIRLCHINSQD